MTTPLFILASDFIQHVVLLVLLGVIALEYILHPHRHYRAGEGEGSTHDTLRPLFVVVFVMTGWVVSKYFLSVYAPYHLLILQTASQVLMGFWLLRIRVPSALKPLRAGLLGLLSMHALAALAYTQTHYPLAFTSSFSALTSGEILCLYLFVLHFLRSTPMYAPEAPTAQVPAFLKHIVSAMVFACVCFAAAPQTVHAFNLTTRISDQSTELRPGDRLYFDVEIKWPENTQRQDLRMEYQIVEDGQVIASEKVLRAVETQASFLDYIVVPQNAKPGMNDLVVKLQTYDGSVNESVSASFHVAPPNDKYFLYFLILAGAVGLVVLLVIFQIMMMARTQQLLSHASSR